jgi:cell shape-determining protein MreC
MSKMLEVSITFLKLILRTITDLLLSLLLIFTNVTNIKLILRISVAVYIYSKIAIILIPVIPSFIIPIPPQIKTFCEAYIANINDLFSKINNTLIEYYTTYTDNKSLREQMQKNQNQIQSLVENEKNIYTIIRKI